MINRQMRSSLKRMLPEPLVHFIGMFLYRGFLPQLRYLIADPINKRRFQALNKGLGTSQIAISPEVVLNIHSDARHPFEHFTQLDAETVEEMQSFIRLTRGKTCFLDVGAHYGIFSLVFACSPDARAFALDPSPPAYEMLRYHQEANPTCNIKPFLLALGDSEGKLRMQYAWTHLVALSPEDVTAENVIDVDVVTMDTFIQQQSIIPDAIKIDTEGFEFNVLKGGINFLKNHAPIIFLEVHPTLLKDLGISVEEVVNLLSSLGYSLYDGRCKLIKNPISFLSNCVRRIICSKEPLM